MLGAGVRDSGGKVADGGGGVGDGGVVSTERFRPGSGRIARQHGRTGGILKHR